MKQMSLSQVCEKLGFTRRVIQGYEKEGLVKHTGKNKYGHLLYDEKQIEKIAYIRYLQINGLTLKEISLCTQMGAGAFVSASLLERNNIKLKKQINKINEIIRKNEKIIEVCSGNEDPKTKENKVLKIIMEELYDQKTI